jgi:acetoacetyl-CoA reductase
MNMARVARRTGGTCKIGEVISKKLNAEGYEIAVAFAGGDEPAAAFCKATGIETYTCNSADDAGFINSSTISANGAQFFV